MTGCASTPPIAAPSAAAHAAPSPAVAAAPIRCADEAGWDDPATPRRIHGNTWYVGTCGIAALLVTGDAGHVVIDAGTEKGGAQVIANIRALGFDPRDVRYVLNTHEHVDHAGGLAAVQRASGARVLARREAVPTLQRGRSDATDPQFSILDPFPPVAGVQPIADGHVVRLGDIELTAHATPGHTAGGTSWTWTSCEAGACRRMAFVDSLSAVSAPGYRFSHHADLLATFRTTFERVAALPCEVLVTPHPVASRLWARLEGDAPLVDAGACVRYAADARARLERRLADEAAGRAP